MAEILALTASIIAIGQAAEKAFKVADSLYRTARRVQTAKDDISGFALKVTNFATAVDAVHISLKYHTSGEDMKSPVLEFIAEHDTLKKLAAQSRRVTDAIRKLRGPIKELEGELSVWKRLKWVMQKKEILALDPEMESVKSSLQLVLSVVMLEVLLSKIQAKTGEEEQQRQI